MNCLIDFKIAKRGKKEMIGSESAGPGDLSMKSSFPCKETGKGKISSTSLPWDILETAHYFFQKKGFEETSLSDICKKLGINKYQFYQNFESLDEVLEILWQG